MKKRHVTEIYLQWTEGKLGDRQRERVAAHLQSCPDCRTYYEEMAAIFPGEADLSALPYLEADPFLPTRIKALADERAKSSSKLRKGWWWGGAFRLALSTLILAAALTIGIYFGKNLATGEQYSESQVVSDYYQAFSQQTYAGNWEYILEENGGETQ